jgi:hypothetical protein
LSGSFHSSSAVAAREDFRFLTFRPTLHTHGPIASLRASAEARPPPGCCIACVSGRLVAASTTAIDIPQDHKPASGPSGLSLCDRIARAPFATSGQGPQRLLHLTPRANGWSRSQARPGEIVG